MSRVTVYTTEPCGYCRTAKKLLDKRGVEYTEVNLAKDADGRAELVARTGMMTFPQVIIDDKPIGGYQELAAADRAGRLSELRAANRLTRKQCADLRDAVVESLEAGLESKGATIDDFRDPDGVRGSFQDRFLVHLREGQPCTRCGHTVRKLRAAGRGTYVCERCQPRPRKRRYAAALSARRSPARSARASS